MQDLESGTRDAAERGKIDPLSLEELEWMQEIFMRPDRVVGVEPGKEVIFSDDIGPYRLLQDSGNSAVGISMGLVQAIQVHERAFGCDIMTLCHSDASFKAVKPILADKLQRMESAYADTIIPILFDSMPNLGLYFQPDGPFPNPSDLLPKGDVAFALEAQEKAVESATRDMIYICEALEKIGCDGVNFDTVGSAGDADLLAALRAIEYVKKNTHLNVEIGMAAEFVLGMHGSLQYNGEPLAGIYPNQQVRLVEQAGADIFGLVVNTKQSATVPWNLARAVTFCKACSAVATIPIHANVGMGVGGVPMCETPPVETVSRVSKTLVEIGKADGL
jgi:dimethylamine--corrinoid protein Co-methyltransferase